jgi:rRNA maturation protein Nop10
MQSSRICLVLAALALVTAMSVLPTQVASAAPDTTVVLPSNGATLSGTTQYLDATASSGVSEVQYELTGGPLTDSVIATATPTIYGWAATWNTTSVANGSYTLHSVASSGGITGTSSPVSITVSNAAPSTTVVLPSDCATLSGTTQYLDATASSDVSEVQYELTGGPLNGSVIATATPTYVGWAAAWNITTVANGIYTLESVASYSGGVTGVSPPVTITVISSPPSTCMITPANATLDDAQGWILDAVASAGATSVTFEVNTIPLPAVATIYGWIYDMPATTPCGACVGLTEENDVQSVATFPGGVSVSSPLQGDTFIVYIPEVGP